MSDIVKPPSTEMVDLVDRAAYYGKSTIADETRESYETHWVHFSRWAAARCLPTNPPDVATVAVYLAALADGNVEVHWHDRQGRPRTTKTARKYGSIQHCYQGLVHCIRKAGHDWPFAIPAITKVMHGIKYRNGDKKKRMTPLEIGDLRACLAKMRERRFEDLTIIRDRALLSLGFFSAMRRSEIVGLNVGDLEWTKDGLVVHIRKSKGDQFAEGQQVGIKPQKDPNVCAVALLRRYLEVSELKSGPLFRRIDSRSDCMGDKPLTKQVVGMIVKQYAERAGLDPTKFAGHSLRAGFVTTAAAKGVTLANIMRQTRHKSERVAATYIRPATVFRDNPTEGLGDDVGTCDHSWVSSARGRWCPKCGHREANG
jgi:integrase